MPKATTKKAAKRKTTGAAKKTKVSKTTAKKPAKRKPSAKKTIATQAVDTLGRAAKIVKDTLARALGGAASEAAQGAMKAVAPKGTAKTKPASK